MKSGRHSGDGPDADIPRNRADWVKKQYFPALGDASLDVCGRHGQTNAGRQTRSGCAWCMPSETKIRRHVKIRAECQSVRPAAGSDYFEERAFFKKFGIHRQKPGLNRRETGSAHAGLCSGLSRMRGNFHVRF